MIHLIRRRWIEEENRREDWPETIERFIGFLIEHFGGDFPLWIAPKQVVILPISEKNNAYK